MVDIGINVLFPTVNVSMCPSALGMIGVVLTSNDSGFF